MEIELLKGQFEKQEANSLLTQLIDVKIKFHESKISGDSNEETIKMREGRIKELQSELYELQKFMQKKEGPINLSGSITVS